MGAKLKRLNKYSTLKLRRNTKLANSKRTILLVEADNLVRTYVAIVLESEGYKVLEAVDIEEAINHVRKYGSSINLIITNVIIPGGRGKDLIKRVQEKHPNVKALYTTGRDDESLLHYGIPEEEKNLLKKPFEPKVLLEKVKEILYNGGD